jgi:hypothetical protein
VDVGRDFQRSGGLRRFSPSDGIDPLLVRGRSATSSFGNIQASTFRSPERLIPKLGISDLRPMNRAQQLARYLKGDEFFIRHLPICPVWNSAKIIDDQILQA